MSASPSLASALAGRSCAEARAATAFAPANIALVKYWGKREARLNLPRTGSLSLSLGTLGTTTSVEPAAQDSLALGGEPVDPASGFAKRLWAFVDEAAPGRPPLAVATENTIPTAAGLASSASGFAALVLALDRAFGWRLPRAALSVLARQGSGSACRSLWRGFVAWRAGTRDDGLDSHGEPLEARWPELRIGLLLADTGPKAVGSREAMNHTVATSPLYAAWPAAVEGHLREIRSAIAAQDVHHLGRVAEASALTMHATMLAADPAVVYWRPESVRLIHEVRRLREDGLPVYLTMDAGPNLKLLYEAASEPAVQSAFPGLTPVDPWSGPEPGED